MNLDYEVNSADTSIELRIRASKQYKEEIYKILGDASQLALEMMQQKVPQGRLTGNMDNERTIRDSLDRGAIRYQPGASGGGGYYELEVGAINNPPAHLGYMFDGTRGYPMRNFSKGRDKPKAYYTDNRAASRQIGTGNIGKLMGIRKKGEGVRYRYSRAGQEPQRDWYLDTAKNVDAFIAAKIMAFEPEIFTKP